MFDGESRMDFKLSAKGSKPFKTDGFSGDVIVCGVKFVPRSGYKKGRSDVEYLKKLDTMEIWFAKAEAGNVYAPVYVRVPTKYGPVTVWPRGSRVTYGVKAHDGSGHADRFYRDPDVGPAGAFTAAPARCRRSSSPPSALRSAACRGSGCSC